MLSGKVPFQTKSKNDSASTIMRRIKDGQFDFSSSEWKDVSQKAKDLIQGTLILKCLETHFSALTLQPHPQI